MPQLSPTRPKVTARPHYVYWFGDGTADGDRHMKDVLGGKGANLAEMCRLGLPVPPGFTISTDVCTWFYAHARQYPKQLESGGGLADREANEHNCCNRSKPPGTQTRQRASPAASTAPFARRQC